MLDLNANGKDDLVEIKEYVIEIASEAWQWLLAELKKLLPKAVAALRAAAQHVIDGLVGQRPFGEIVADVLNVLYREFQDIAAEIKSDVISSYVSLVHGPKLVTQ
jgi:hypothetical protein